MKKILINLSIILMSVVLVTAVYAVSDNNISSVSTKNNIVDTSVKYNDDILLKASDAETKTFDVEENSIQKDADNINKNERKETIFVLGGVLLAFTVATVYEINHD